MRFQRLAINGKFLTAGPTGVHLVAEQLIAQLAARGDELAHLFLDAPKLVVPTTLTRETFEGFALQRGGRFKGQLWEQLDLPRLARSDLLLNLCNLAPMASRASMTMIHDAQVFSTPQSYPQSFAWWYRKVLPVLGRRQARILAVSDFTANELVRFGIAKPENISVVRNGADHVLAYGIEPGILDRLSLRPRSFVVGLANRQPHKNIGVLLKAFADEQLSDISLVLVGSEGAAPFLSAGYPVSANVKFAGRIKNQELRSLFENAICVAFPSLTEGFGLPPLEGMRLGCPAVVSNCGALPEVGGDSVLLADPLDPRAWVDAIRQLAKDQDCWNRYSGLGRQRASCFTWRRAGEELLAAIRQVVSEAAFNKPLS